MTSQIQGDVVIGYSEFVEYAAITRDRAHKDKTTGGFSILGNPLGLDTEIFLGARWV